MEILLQEFEKAKLLSSCVQCEDFVSATKLLACSHVMCEDCYSQMGSRCPHCAHYVNENEGVEENYFLDLFLKYEQIISQLKAQHVCTKCKHLPSSTYCQHCDLLLCSVDFQMEHSQNCGINQHEYLCTKHMRNHNGHSVSENDEIKNVFVKSSVLQTNEKIASINHGLSVYDMLQNIWQGRHDNIERNFEDINTLENNCVSQVNQYYEEMIQKAREMKETQMNDVKKYYEGERDKLRNKLKQTEQFVQKLEQTKSLIRIYAEFSDTYELVDKSAAILRRLERIFKEFAEKKWSYPDIVQIQFHGCNINKVTDMFGSLKRYRNFQAKFYPKFSFGSYGKSTGHFQTIQGLAIHRDKTLFISDSGSKCVHAFSTTGKFRFSLSEGHFIDPGHISVNGDLVYVSDVGRCDVQIFNCEDGSYVGKLGRKGNKEEELASPSGVAVSNCSRNIYVVDRPKQCIKVYSPNYVYIKAMCKGHLMEPCDIAIGTNDDIYVVDCSCKCVHVFNQDGDLLREFGYRGEDKELVNPCYLALDGGDHVMLSDRMGHKICVYTVRGDLVNRFGGFGSSPGKVRFPNGVAVDSEGNIFVCDTSNHRVQKF